MSLKAHEQQVLNAIEDELTRSDPKMSMELGKFNRLSAGEAFPAREQICFGWRRYGQLAWPLLWLAICVALIAVALLVSHDGGGAQGTCPGWPAACTGSAIPTG